MKKDGTMQGSKVQLILSALTIALGVLLLVYMVTVEDEPGALPLMLIIAGTGWHLVTRRRTRSHEAA